MNKVVLIILCAIGIIVGAVLIWNVVLPLLGFTLDGIFGVLGSIFGGLLNLLHL